MSKPLADIAIVGAGGLGKETAVLIAQINKHANAWNLIGFFDDGLPPGSRVLSLPVLGGINTLNAHAAPLNIVMAIGNPEVKARLAEHITNPRITYPVLVHPAAHIGENVTVGEGSLITAGCVLTVDIRIGKHVLVNLNTTIGHDVSVGDYASIMPGAHLSGFVTLGRSAFIGTGASVLQHVEVGTGARVGAGAVVTKPVPERQTVIGIPARPTPSNLKP